MEPFNYYVLIPFVAFIINTSLIAYIAGRRRGSPVNTAYLYYAGIISGWLFLDLPVFLRVDEDAVMLLFALQNFTWIPFGFALLHFTYVLINKKRDVIYYSVAFAVAVTLILSLTTDWIVEGYRNAFWGFTHDPGPYRGEFMFLAVIAPILYSFFLMVKKYRSTENTLERKQLFFLSNGIMLGVLVGYITTGVLPDFFGAENVVPLHPVGVLIQSLAIFIAIVRYRFMNIEVSDVADDLFAKMHDGVVILDKNNQVQHLNKMAIDMLGLTFQDISNTLLPLHSYFENYPSAEYFNETEVKPRRMVHKTYTISKSQVMDNEGVAGKLVVLRDITERKKAEIEVKRINEELSTAHDKALDASRMKSQFLANMSHELRTPLNAVIGYSEIVQEEAIELDQNQIADDAGKINSAGRHLLALINDILDLSKIEAGKMDLYLEDFEIEGMVHDVSTTIAPLLDTNSNRIHIVKDSELGEMHGDLTKIRQILFNFLSNAAKFTKNGVITVTVQPLSIQGRPFIRFAVKDEGIGMNAEQLENIFQAFSQADASTTRKYGGTGLGLSITKHFCEMMGGHVNVRSEQGKGSEFEAVIPRIIESDGAIEKKDDTVAQATTSRMSQILAPSGDERREKISTILVIDDDTPTREMICRHLEKEGFYVISAESGEEGLDKARWEKPDAITLDVMMPGMDGWSVLHAIRQDNALAHIPVIMLTMVDDRNLGFALGATEYMVKPIVKDRLSELVKLCVRKGGTGTVMVIDDDQNMRELVRSILEEDNWKVIEAENGSQGLSLLEKNTPQLILVDLLMPEMDGFEFLRTLRQHDEWKKIPAIVVSAEEINANTFSRLEGLAQDIMSKNNFTPEQLINEVKLLVHNR